MISKQKRIEAAKKRIDDRARQLLDPEEYQRCVEVGRAKYASDEDFVKAVIELTRWAENREKSKKSA